MLYYPENWGTEISNGKCETIPWVMSRDVATCYNGWWLKNGTFFKGLFSVDKTIFGSNQWNSVVKQAILNKYGLWQAPMSPFWLVQEGFFLQAQKSVCTVGPKIVLAQSLLLCPRAHVGLLAIFRACTCVARTPKKSSMVWDCQNLLWSITFWTKLTLHIFEFAHDFSFLGLISNPRGFDTFQTTNI